MSLSVLLMGLHSLSGVGFSLRVAQPASGDIVCVHCDQVLGVLPGR